MFAALNCWIKNTILRCALTSFQHLSIVKDIFCSIPFQWRLGVELEPVLKTCRDLIWRPQLPHDGTPAHWRCVCSLGNCFLTPSSSPAPPLFPYPRSCQRPRWWPPDALIAMDCEPNSGKSRSRHRKSSASSFMQPREHTFGVFIFLIKIEEKAHLKLDWCTQLRKWLHERQSSVATTSHQES